MTEALSGGARGRALLSLDGPFRHGLAWFCRSFIKAFKEGAAGRPFRAATGSGTERTGMYRRADSPGRAMNEEEA